MCEVALLACTSIHEDQAGINAGISTYGAAAANLGLRAGPDACMLACSAASLSSLLPLP